MRRAAPLATLVLALGCAGLRPPALGETFAPPRTDAELGARLRFLEDRLSAGQLHAVAWWWGWLGIESFSGVSQVVDATDAHKVGDRARDVVNAVVSGVGLLDLLVLRPMPGRDGAGPLRAMPDVTRAEKLARLARGETMLCEIAARAQTRRSWPVHAGNLALAIAGGAVVLGFGRPATAATTAASNFVGGEIQIWSEPWRGTRDLDDYRRLVDSGQARARAPARSWSVRPAPDGGVALEMRF